MVPNDMDQVIASLELAKADWQASVLGLQEAIIQRDRLQAQLDALRDTVAQQSQVIEELEAEIVLKDEEIAALKAGQPVPTEPPPVPQPAYSWLVTGPPGGGGPNTFCQQANGDIRYGYDVGGGIHIPKDHPELAHPCDWGELDRHVVSMTPAGTTGVLRWMGNPGHKYGAQLLDVATDRWGAKLVGTEKAAGNSQNSYGEPDGGWKYGIADSPYNRSAGELCYLEPNGGQFVVGQFGYTPPGAGVMVVEPNGSSRIIPGTEQWACRNVKRETDSTALVSVWTHTVTWGRVMSPGGLYRVNWKTNKIDKLRPDSVESSVVAGANIWAVTWKNGIFESKDGGVSWTDISGNAPKSTKWRSIDYDSQLGLVISGSNPVSGFCWATKSPTGNTWTNLSASVDSRDLTTLAEWHPPSGNNDMGKSGCTLTQTRWVNWKGKKVPGCIGVGVFWLFLDGKCRPLAYGGGITSNRDVAASDDGQHAIITMMDHRLQATHDGGTSWAKKDQTNGLGGPIDFTTAGFKRDTKQFLCQGGDGSRWISQPVTATTKTLQWTSTNIDPKAHNQGSPDLVVTSTDIKWKGSSIDEHVRQRMGDVSKVHYTGGHVYAIGHGAMRRKVT